MPSRELLFDAAGGGGWTIFLVVAALLTAACLILLFRYERRLLPRRLGWLLLGLRLAAVAVLLFALLEPQLRSTYERQQSGRIVVAIDVSQSMETADRSLSTGEALRLARALGMIGNAASAAELDAWQAALDQNREPDWATGQEAADTERRAELADARRRNLASLQAEIATLPRLEIVRRLLREGRTNVIDRLSDISPVERRLFAGRIVDSGSDGFLDQLARPADELQRETSDLARPFESASSDGPVAAVVLLTDGRDTQHQDAAQLAATARSAGAPVYPVLIGSEQRPKDISVTAVDAPAAVFLNDRPVVRVGLKTAGFTGQPLEVTLTPEGAGAGGEPLTQTVTPATDAAEVQFTLPADTLGRRRYSVGVEPQPGETRSDNNARQFSFNVVDDRSRVLLVDSEPRWEFRYLVAALERDAHVEVDTVLFEQPYLGILPETFFPRALATEAANDEQQPAPFDKYDAVLIGDVAPQQMPADVWQQLERYVRESGGTLVLMAGKRSLPRAYRNEALTGLMPVDRLEEVGAAPLDAVRSPGDRGFRLQLTPDGEAAGALALDGEPAQSRRIWERLPGHTWGLSGRAKPGSTVWATAARAGEQPDLQAERDAAVLVEQHAGAGRVVWIGIDSTWRWRSRVGDLYHHRFWGQLVRAAAEFKAAVHNELVQFGPERPQIDEGESAVIRARWSESFLRQHPDVAASVELTRVDVPEADDVMTVSLAPKADRPRDFEAHVPELPAGEYRVRLLADNAGDELGELAAELSVLAKTTPELNDLTANRPLLEQIAAATGGELLLPDELAQLPDRLLGTSAADQVQRTVPLWNHWSLLALFCALVGTEWLLRKLNGLP